MAGKPRTQSEKPTRKTRTREHVIASQSVAHVENIIAATGYTAERVFSDYGYDLIMSTFTPEQEAEPGNILIQIKGADGLRVLQDTVTIPFRIEWADLALWREELMPVILAVYDVAHETAYWLYVQHFCETTAKLLQTDHTETVTVYLHKDNVLDGDAVETFRQYKQAIFDQTEGKVKHHG